jgi:putative tricarboxylic transport membrane protein
MGLFGVVGYLMKRSSYEAAPVVMAMVLSPLMENSLRQSLLLSDGSFLIFFTRPISAIFMIAAALLLVLKGLPGLKIRNFRNLEPLE